MVGPMRRGLPAFIATVVLGLCAAAPAARAADDLPFVNWPSLLPALATGFTPNTFDVCVDGSPQCVQDTLAEMRSRLAVYDAQCDHRALFLRNYLTVTEHYARTPTSAMQDPVYFNQEDAVFAKLYFDAVDAHAQGRRQDVPPAWRVALDAARDKTVEGAGDLLLGINAHVQRDMPFMLAGLGLVTPDGRSRKPDHDLFNAVLSASFDEVYARATAMDDPRLALYNPPGQPVVGMLAFQMVAGWREVVWRNAERLVAARTPQERAKVAGQIEQNALGWAEVIKLAFSYKPPISSVEPRTAHCRSGKRRDPGPGLPPEDLKAKDLVRVDLGPIKIRIRL